MPENNVRSPSYSKEKLRSIEKKGNAQQRRNSDGYDDDERSPIKHNDPMESNNINEFSELPMIANRKKD